MPTDPYTQLAEDIANCNWNDRQTKLDLISKRHTQEVFHDMVLEEAFSLNTDAAMFRDFFGTEDFNWGKLDLTTETYYHPVLPFDWSRWRRMYNHEQCDDEHANASDISGCVRCREVLPTGGYSKDTIEFYQGGLRTEPYCIDKIKGHRDWLQYENRIVTGMTNMSEAFINQWSIWAVFATTGHKILLQNDHPAAASNIFPILDQYPNNYRGEVFHEATDPDSIMPFTLGTAQQFAHDMIESRNFNGASKTANGKWVYQFWTSGDWYRNNILQDAEYAKALLHMQPSRLFRGYSLDDGMEVEVYDNILPRTMPDMPRFGDNAAGPGIVPVQPQKQIDIEIGTRAIKNVDHRDAPYELIMAPSPNQACYLRPEPITHSQGIEIPNALYQNKGWYPWNEFDKECNPEKNMPEWRFDFDIGLRPKQRDEGLAMLARRQVFRVRPNNTCDLMPRLMVTPEAADCVSGDDCDHPHGKLSNSITDGNVTSDAVRCTHATCGNPNQAWIKIEAKAFRPEFKMACDCGDELLATFDDGSTGTIKLVDNRFANPLNLYLVEKLDGPGGTAEAMPEGLCIRQVDCYDASPKVGQVLSGADGETVNTIEVTLDNVISCPVTTAVTGTWKDADGATTNTDTITLTSVDTATNFYVFTSTTYAFDDGAGGTLSTITCP